jgi:hypothetical protein
MTKNKTTKEYVSGEERSLEVVKEISLNVIQAALHFKVPETSKSVMLKKFKNDSMTIAKWEASLTKEKINF